ncbi:MAG: hypothetical protein C4541_05755 [Candidatus Auribacter fodinae]|uniref:Uncharacterized protein n=1 Tax=Candidatus Auribacter fodinae TaxID=2093366 RepID=A0A3A4RB49_9BACT|nr:MAG: hypothetical protein C4541_05755 [Candidatus Auribacter fodinae]
MVNVSCILANLLFRCLSIKLNIVIILVVNKKFVSKDCKKSRTFSENAVETEKTLLGISCYATIIERDLIEKNKDTRCRKKMKRFRKFY